MRLAFEDGRCIRARRALSLALDGEAGAADVLAAVRHINRCECCRRFATHVVAFTHELRSVRLDPSGRGGETEHLTGGGS